MTNASRLVSVDNKSVSAAKISCSAFTFIFLSLSLCWSSESGAKSSICQHCSLAGNRVSPASATHYLDLVLGTVPLTFSTAC